MQLEFFPEIRHVEAIDPRLAIGRETRVKALYRVRYGESQQVHEVYHDRHGWYCAKHKPKCPAMSNATTAASPR